MKKKTNIGIIGLGKMGEAILHGAFSTKILKAKHIFFVAHHPKRDVLLKRKYKIQLSPTLQDLCEKTKIILLAVKPQDIPKVIAELKKYWDHHLLISIAAGMETSYYKKHLGQNTKILRVLPNTPSRIGYGAAGYFATGSVSRQEKSFCEKLFSAIGIVVSIKKESQMNGVLAVSASGPAFIYEYARAVAQAGCKLGLSKEQSRILTLETLHGATQMIRRDNFCIQNLIAQVASKGGTTLAGLSILKKKGFTKIIEECMESSAKRARELNKKFGK